MKELVSRLQNIMETYNESNDIDDMRVENGMEAIDDLNTIKDDLKDVLSKAHIIYKFCNDKKLLNLAKIVDTDVLLPLQELLDDDSIKSITQVQEKMKKELE